MTLINIPLTLASTAPTSMIPEVSSHYAKGDLDGARSKIDKATWISMFISIPCTVGLAVLSGPITRLLFPSTTGAGGQLMLLGAITIILNGNSNISNGVLQGIGKPNIPMKNAAIALVAGLAWALSTVLWKKGMVNGCDKWVGLSIHYPTTWICVFIYLALSNNLAAYKMSGNAILALMGSGVASGLIGVTAFMMALKTTSVNKANVIKSAYPILLSVLAWLIFGEYMNIWMFIGIALTVVGVVIVNRSDVGSKAKAAA